jgi:hypothetical protein
MGSMIGSIRHPLESLEEYFEIRSKLHNNYRIIYAWGDEIVSHDDPCPCYKHTHTHTKFTDIYVTLSCWQDLMLFNRR